MIDPQHVPAALQTLVVMTTGSQWPTGDEGALRARADAWDTVADGLQTCLHQVEEVRGAVARGLDDAAAAVVDDHLARFTTTPHAVLPALLRCCRSAAESLRHMANEVQLLRIVVLGTLAVLAVQLLIDLTVLALFGGAAMAAAAVAATRAALQVLVRRVVVGLAARVFESVLAQVGFTLLGQVVQLGQRNRDSLDGRSLRKAAVNGAVGGAVGASAGLLVAVPRAGARRLGPAVHAVAGHSVPATAATRHLPRDVVATATRTARGTASLVGYAGWGALTGMAEASAQDAVWGTSGNWEAGAANGAFNGAWGVRHAALNPHDVGSIAVSQQIENAIHRRFPGTADGSPAPRAPRAPRAPGASTPVHVPVDPPVIPPLDLPSPTLEGVVPRTSPPASAGPGA